MTADKPTFVLCVARGDYDELDLVLWKVYLALPENEPGYLRIVDESEEDYLYPAEWFVPVELPEAVAERIAADQSPVGTS